MAFGNTDVDEEKKQTNERGVKEECSKSMVVCMPTYFRAVLSLGVAPKLNKS